MVALIIAANLDASAGVAMGIISRTEKSVPLVVFPTSKPLKYKADWLQQPHSKTLMKTMMHTCDDEKKEEELAMHMQQYHSEHNISV